MSQIAIITGGSRGLGKSMVQHVAAQGTDIILTYHSKEVEAQALVKEVQALGRRAAALQLDVSNQASFADFTAQVKATLQGWNESHFHFLVNNAGVGLYGSFAETTPEQLDQLYNIHVKGPFFLTQALLPLIADGGRIVNVSTGLTRFALPGYAAYAAMKGAIETLTRYQALELGARKISVNVVAPGAIATDFGGGMVRDNKAVNEMVASHTAQGRVGQPDDIGGAVAALLSPGMNWVTAQRIEASGGQNL